MKRGRNVGAPVRSTSDGHELTNFTPNAPKFSWAAQAVKKYAINCSKCGKGRIIPDKESYEIIRESILEQRWICGNALKWNPRASCDLPDEVEATGFVVTADRPGIPATPAGWERVVHIRAGPNSRQFADVFYFAPPGVLSRTERRMRSFQDIIRIVKKYPELLPGDVDIMKRFSFATPMFPTTFAAPSGAQGKYSDGLLKSPSCRQTRSAVRTQKIKTRASSLNPDWNPAG